MHVSVNLKKIHIWVSWRRNYRFGQKRHIVVKQLEDLQILAKEMKKEGITFWVKKGYLHDDYYIFIKGEILAYTDKESILLSVSKR